MRFWGFRAPLGAWVCIWGAFAMLTSAPFDDWWHNAYGLDVKIISPPHMLLAAGIGAIQCGAMLMALAWQNRAAGDRRHLGRLYLLGAGLLVLLVATVATEYIQRWDMHQSLFYQVSRGRVRVLPRQHGARLGLALAGDDHRARLHGPDAGDALVLPLFPAQPLLGPIYVQVDRFMPPDFPLLLVVPALAIDCVMRRVGADAPRLGCSPRRSRVVFVAMFVAVQWPFADFLMSPWARNDFFGSHRMDYGVPPDIQARWYRINPPDDLGVGLPIAMAIAFVSARFGLWWGNWMSRVQR